MIKTLKRIIDSEKEILKSETSIAEKKYRETVSKMDSLKHEFETKSIAYVSFSKNEEQYISRLIKNGVPQCPRCIVRSNDFHDMSPHPVSKNLLSITSIRRK